MLAAIDFLWSPVNQKIICFTRCFNTPPVPPTAPERVTAAGYFLTLQGGKGSVRAQTFHSREVSSSSGSIIHEAVSFFIETMKRKGGP